LITDLQDLQQSASRCVLLYSGGLDSSYFLTWAIERGLSIVALKVDVGGSGPGQRASDELAGHLGITIDEIDATAEFATDFIGPAIRANGLHQGIYPISSSLSRPLLAKLAVQTATAVGADCVVHTAEIHQNSFARFNTSLRALAPDLLIAAPFLEDHRSRQHKLDALAELADAEREIYSIDANLWARVIENGELDDVRTTVPDHVFTWTVNPAEAPRETTYVTLRFEEGIPVGLDDDRLPLAETVTRLNLAAGRYGIGRFNGVEGTRFGLKNHEVREAPAAAVILGAHRHLEQLVLTDRELRMKALVDHEWIELAVLGGWYTGHHIALDAYESTISKFVVGEVTVALRPGCASVTAVDSPNGLQEYGNPVSIVGAGGLNLARAFELDTVDLTVRGDSLVSLRKETYDKYH